MEYKLSMCTKRYKHSLYTKRCSLAVYETLVTRTTQSLIKECKNWERVGHISRGCVGHIDTGRVG